MEQISAMEPTLDELLDDPMVRLVMARDGVTDAEVKALFASAPPVPRCRHPE